jgi:hypothetical protein
MGLVDDADDVQVPLVGELVVQAADDVQLRGAAPLGLGRPLQDLLVGHHVALRALQVGPEGAEGAAIDADVCRVEMGVDVVVGELSVLALADPVGQLAQGEQVGAVVKEDAVVERQALPGLDLLANRLQAGLGWECGHDAILSAEVAPVFTSSYLRRRETFFQCAKVAKPGPLAILLPATGRKH